jgi:hypothetical protein
MAPKKALSCSHGMLDMFSGPMVENKIENTVIEQIATITALPKISSGYIEFFVFPSTSLIDLYNSYFSLDLQIVKKEGNKYVPIEGEIVTLCPFLGGVVFSQCEIRINKQLVTDFDNNFHYYSYLTAVCDLSETNQKSRLSGALALFDSPGASHAMDLELVQKSRFDNYSKRTAVCTGGKIFSIQFPLLHQLFQVTRFLPTETELSIKLYFNKPEVLLISLEKAELNLKVHSAHFNCRKVQLTEAALEAHKKLVKAQTPIYPVFSPKIQTYSLYKGDTGFSRNISLSSALPRRAIVALCDSESYDGTLKKSAFSFPHYLLSELYFLHEGQRFPLNTGYSPNFRTNDVSKDFFMLQNEMNHKNGNLCFDQDAWSIDYNIYIAQFSQDHSFGCGYINPPRSGNLYLSIKFSEPLSEAVTVIVILEFAQQLEVSTHKVEWKDL